MGSSRPAALSSASCADVLDTFVTGQSKMITRECLLQRLAGGAGAASGGGAGPAEK